MPDKLKAPPQSKVLGALSRVAKAVDEPLRSVEEVLPAPVSWLVPRTESLGNVLEGASYGMNLTTGRGLGGTLGLKPDVAYAALDVSGVAPTATAAKVAKKLAKKVPQEAVKVARKFEPDPEVVASMLAKIPKGVRHFEPDPELVQSMLLRAGYAKGGAIKGALSRIARMVGADEPLKEVSPIQAVKEQGGQWLPGSSKAFTEDVMAYGRGADSPEVRDWARKAVPKYIEKYLGAKGDPLANVEIPFGDKKLRWEEMTDPLISSQELRSLGSHLSESSIPTSERKRILQENPWMAKLPPETTMHEVWQGSSLTKRYVQDYISHALDYAATLPPEKLKNYDFPRLVKEVQKIDAERAKKMASVEGRMEGTVPHTEYPSGYKWVEVQSPEALKLEGDVMGHCVGGYCERVKSGETKILSLRDPQGQSHVTVEVGKGKPWDETSGVLYNNPKLESDWVQYYSEARKERGGKNDPNIIKGFPDWLSKRNPKLFEEHAHVFEEPPGTIKQIKGKQNLAPKEEYQAYVQDLIRQGKWGEVRDLQNAGLIPIEKSGRSASLELAERGYGPEQMRLLEEKYGKYISQKELKEYEDELRTRDLGMPMKRGGHVCKCEGGSLHNYAKGGSIEDELRYLEYQGYMPWNWGDAARDRLAQQRFAIRQRMAREAKNRGLWGQQQPIVPPERRAEGGFVKLPSHKNVPDYRYGYKRLQSSVPSGADMAKGGPVKKTVDIKEQSRPYPIVRHVFQGETAEEALGYLDAHKKSDDFMRDCMKSGKYKGIPCSAKKYAEGGPITDEVLDVVRQVESGGDPRAVSPKGALGHYQFMPATAKELGIDPLDPSQARSGARRYLEQLYGQTGSLEDAFVAYNWGIGNLKKYGKQNMPKETRDYLTKIFARLGKQEQGIPDTLVSQPHNQADPIKPPEPTSVDTQPEGTTSQVAQASVAAPSVDAGLLGAQLSKQKASPMPRIGEGGNALAMVDKLLKDPLSLSRG